MDIKMPVLDGIKATKKIREIEELKKTGESVPIIGTTAYAAPGAREQFIKAGMNEVLFKPFNPSEIKALIKEQNRDQLTYKTKVLYILFLNLLNNKRGD